MSKLVRVVSGVTEAKDIRFVYHYDDGTSRIVWIDGFFAALGHYWTLIRNDVKVEVE